MTQVTRYHSEKDRKLETENSWVRGRERKRSWGYRQKQAQAAVGMTRENGRNSASGCHRIWRIKKTYLQTSALENGRTLKPQIQKAYLAKAMNCVLKDGQCGPEKRLVRSEISFSIAFMVILNTMPFAKRHKWCPIIYQKVVKLCNAMALSRSGIELMYVGNISFPKGPSSQLPSLQANAGRTWVIQR